MPLLILLLSEGKRHKQSINKKYREGTKITSTNRAVDLQDLFLKPGDRPKLRFHSSSTVALTPAVGLRFSRTSEFDQLAL